MNKEIKKTAEILLRLAIGTDAKKNVTITITEEGVKAEVEILGCYDKFTNQSYFLSNGNATHELCRFIYENNGYFWTGVKEDGKILYFEIILKGVEE